MPKKKKSCCLATIKTMCTLREWCAKRLNSRSALWSPKVTLLTHELAVSSSGLKEGLAVSNHSVLSRQQLAIPKNTGTYFWAAGTGLPNPVSSRKVNHLRLTPITELQMQGAMAATSWDPISEMRLRQSRVRGNHEGQWPTLPLPLHVPPCLKATLRQLVPLSVKALSKPLAAPRRHKCLQSSPTHPSQAMEPWAPSSPRRHQM